MSPQTSDVKTEPQAPELERVLGSYSTGRPGPNVVVTAGIHGNEPAGVEALRRVFALLSERRLPLRGTLIGLTGNLAALRQRRRFVARDLNRGWTQARVDALLARDAAQDDSEDREQRELLGIFRGVFAEAREPVVFLDVHSTSAGGAPFCAIADTLRNRHIAFALPVPVILGLEELLTGTMLSFLDGLGHVSAVFEGGQNEDPVTVDNDVAAIWIALEAAGALDPADVPDRAAHLEQLRSRTRDIPHVVEVCYRHAIRSEDAFVMRPGYVNFQPIARGEPLATDCAGPVLSRHRALILMPLYQSQGDDGYFVVREVKRFWLEISKWIRKARLDALLPLLPGVRWHAADKDVLVADRRVARFLVVQIFHLFGFSAAGEENGKLLFRRRRPDWRGVRAVEHE